MFSANTIFELGCVSKVIRAMFESKSQQAGLNPYAMLGCVSKVIRAMFESKSQLKVIQ